MSQSTKNYYIAKTPDGKYLIDANWADEQGGYDLVFEPAVLELDHHKIYKNCNFSDMVNKISEWVPGDDADNCDIFQVKEIVTRDITKI